MPPKKSTPKALSAAERKLADNSLRSSYYWRIRSMQIGVWFALLLSLIATGTAVAFLFNNAVSGWTASLALLISLCVVVICIVVRASLSVLPRYVCQMVIKQTDY